MNCNTILLFKYVCSPFEYCLENLDAGQDPAKNNNIICQHFLIEIWNYRSWNVPHPIHETGNTAPYEAVHVMSGIVWFDNSLARIVWGTLQKVLLGQWEHVCRKKRPLRILCGIVCMCRFQPWCAQEPMSAWRYNVGMRPIATFGHCTCVGHCDVCFRPRRRMEIWLCCAPETRKSLMKSLRRIWN